MEMKELLRLVFRRRVRPVFVWSADRQPNRCERLIMEIQALGPLEACSLRPQTIHSSSGSVTGWWTQPLSLHVRIDEGGNVD